ncbi:hypothetical protein DRH27_03770 [Candidatus Falkowbacteria bacterium]|nr:MAG: hypothetical protein DRH27_03770 [Candidatus Falkowbacteria bacterium]
MWGTFWQTQGLIWLAWALVGLFVFFLLISVIKLNPLEAFAVEGSFMMAYVLYLNVTIFSWVIGLLIIVIGYLVARVVAGRFLTA